MKQQTFLRTKEADESSSSDSETGFAIALNNRIAKENRFGLQE